MQKQIKNQTGIWIDGNKALIVSFIGDEVKISEVNSDMDGVFLRDGQPIKTNFSGGNNDSHEKRLEERKKNNTRKFLKTVSDAVQKADELYIIGPGEMRTKLSRFMEAEYKIFTAKIKGVASCEKLRESQIITRMKSFFNLEEKIEL